ncbi:MAG: archaemetzincin family Zn-dependent metalloprotease [Chloroflexota bacterium]|nr:archaemetzincin family Zn-dependent metalloprotease [Chloroflexota bacterium]
MKITLKPLGDVDSETMEELRGKVNLVFHCPVEIKQGFSYLAHAYNPERRQYLSANLLASLNSPPREKEERAVGIVDVDLYIPRLDFIFGEADASSGTAIISLCRLRQEYYGLAPDKTLFIERATKEITHELGHTFGLGHCPDARCIMHFSNCLADTDYKELNFCTNCRPRMMPVT